MSPAERPGVHPTWLKQNEPAKKLKPHYAEGKLEEQRKDLEDFLAMQREEWWDSLPMFLDQYGIHMLDWFQLRSLESGEWDHESASAVADTFELDGLLYLRGRLQAYRSGEDFYLYGIGTKVYALVLMLLEGETDRALALGNALVSAVHWRGYKPNASMFTEAFILRLLADHLERAVKPVEWPIFKKNSPTPHPVYEALLASWKVKDPKTVEPLLLAALDSHTHLGFSGKNWMDREFTNGFWMRTPLAALLVLKLRALRGLKNPALEHVVLESPMGRMPKPGYKPDAVVGKLRKRLEKELAIGKVPALYRADAPPARK